MARAKNDNLVNEFDRVCHCCQRHIHFERNKSVENVVFFDGLFYHEKCFKESAGFHRKCGGCSKDIIIDDADQEGILVFKNKYWHEDCFRKKYSDKPIFMENIPEYKEDAYVKIVGVFNGRKKNITKLNEYEIAAVKEVDRIFDEKLVNDYIRKQYDIQTVPWDSIAALYDGRYGVKIPPKHLYDMFVRKQSYLDKINAQNIAKGKEITCASRVKYDLKVLYNKYDSYLKFLLRILVYFFFLHYGHQMALPHHRNTAAHVDDLGKLRCHHNNADSTVCKLLHQMIDLGFSPHINSACRLIKDQNFGVCR